jgi:chemotaxis protein methyltransferase CheR
MRTGNIDTVTNLMKKVLHNPEFLELFVREMSVSVSAMFRDPDFFFSFRERAVPLLRSYPFIRIWLAGCAMGEEVYSLAILMKEEGLYSRSLMYATDISDAELRKARAGVFPLDIMRKFTQNYIQAGGKRAFSEYYSARSEGAVLDPALRERVVFAQHNLVTDGSFNEFNVILCRNVMIYFNQSLQARVHQLIYRSLALFGILGLGRKESMRFTPFEANFEEIDERERIFRRIS